MAAASGAGYVTSLDTIDDDCPVCLDNFVDDGLDKVTCGCGYSACRTCVQEYLLHTTSEPHCMKCKRAWDKEFQYRMLTPKFINNKYKKHRKELLFEKEKARLHEAVQYASEYKNRGLLEEEIAVYEEEMRNLRMKLHTLNRKYVDAKNKLQQIKRTGFAERTPSGDKTKRRVFIRKCPNGDCRGFLSTKHVCELCNAHVCSHCLEIKGFTKHAEHTCDVETLKSAKLIKKETRPCPRCATPIYKISGCDQMWCTQCQVAFSWRTGLIDNGRIHNPHFYEFKKNSTDVVIHNPGDVYCGGMPTYERVYRTMKSYCLTFTPLYQQTIDLFRAVIHVQDVVIDGLRVKLNRDDDNIDLRIRYIVKEIDETYMKRYLMQRDNIRSKNTAMLQIFELFSVVMTEHFNKAFAPVVRTTFSDKDSCEKFIKAIMETHDIARQTMEYCNNQFIKISKNYKMKVHKFEDDFSVKTKMYKF